jgi:clan AA aspartic protease (TIGR02281 family)
VLPIAHALWITLRWPPGCRTTLAVTLSLILHSMFDLVAFAAASPVRAQSVSLRAERHNTFRTEVTLNNRVTAPALIDTGASSLSMCSATANALRLKLGNSIWLTTSNGTIPARLANVASVRIGPIEVRNVEAVVKAGGSRCDDGLLVGMSVLRKLHVSLVDDTLILVARGPTNTVGGWKPWALLVGAWIVLVLSVVRLRRQRSRPLSQ